MELFLQDKLQFTPPGIRITNHPSRGLVSIPTELQVLPLCEDKRSVTVTLPKSADIPVALFQFVTQLTNQALLS
jgi:hypothetical protein